MLYIQTSSLVLLIIHFISNHDNNINLKFKAKANSRMRAWANQADESMRSNKSNSLSLLLKLGLLKLNQKFKKWVVSIDLFQVFLMSFSYNGVYSNQAKFLPYPPPPHFHRVTYYDKPVLILWNYIRYCNDKSNGPNTLWFKK